MAQIVSMTVISVRITTHCQHRKKFNIRLKPNTAGLRFFPAHQELYYPSLSPPRGYLPVKYCQLGDIDFFAVMK